MLYYHRSSNARKSDQGEVEFVTPAEASIRLRLTPFEFRRCYARRVRWIDGGPLVLLVGGTVL